MLATSVPILVFLGLSVLDLGPMYFFVPDRTQYNSQAYIRPVARYRLACLC